MPPAAPCAPGRAHPARSLPAVTFERRPGDAAAPLAPSYRRREPERTPLYRVVLHHLETLLAQARQASPDGSGYPSFVEHELRRFLDCGMLAHGFARLKCPACGFERLVAFSCKGRICPSCWGRRAADIAAHLVDRVLPAVPYRQVVLTFPWPLRLRLAMDRAFLSDMLAVFIRTLLAWQRRRGRSLGIQGGQTGAVTFIQRFGGALNLSPHFHSVLPDGLFLPHPRPARSPNLMQAVTSHAAAQPGSHEPGRKSATSRSFRASRHGSRQPARPPYATTPHPGSHIIAVASIVAGPDLEKLPYPVRFSGMGITLAYSQP